MLKTVGEKQERDGVVPIFFFSFRYGAAERSTPRSEEHTSELQSQSNLVCRLLLEKKHAQLLGLHQLARPSDHLRPLRSAVPAVHAGPARPQRRGRRWRRATEPRRTIHAPCVPERS